MQRKHIVTNFNKVNQDENVSDGGLR